MLPAAPLGVLFIEPHLPPWLPDVKLTAIRVGSARLDLASERTAHGGTRYRVTHCEGDIRVIRRPLPTAPGVTASTRALTALFSVPHS
jgi:hypothetical protein